MLGTRVSELKVTTYFYRGLSLMGPLLINESLDRQKKCAPNAFKTCSFEAPPMKKSLSCSTRYKWRLH